VLEVIGHETTTAYDGPSALERAERFAADVVLLDLGIPGIDGYEVCRRLRSLNSRQSLAIVALTGWGRDPRLQENLESVCRAAAAVATPEPPLRVSCPTARWAPSAAGSRASRR
jgi:CheY-like chemotaxis protein